MHHHLFPTEDTYITNDVGFENKNFGINEILRIGTNSQEVKTLEYTKTFSYVNVVWNGYCAQNFTGTFSGSFSGSAVTANGIVVSSASFSSSYFTGSVNGINTETSGSVSGSVSGSITGSLYAYYLPNFSGQLTGSVGDFTGTVTGTDTIFDPNWVISAYKFVNRTLMQFDVSSISASLAAGNISNPSFTLNLKVCNEYDLPITYKIYAFPVSQSWVMGNGYFSDGGSDDGASWYYRDFNGGTAWSAPITTSIRPLVDFLNNSGSATGSFNYGGGTWYYADSNTSSSTAIQNFNYDSSDISMDVTNIVMSWINGSLPNNGFILLSSDEIVASGSGFALTFYGRDTNSINSPYLDVMWNDCIQESGSIATSSVNIFTANSGITASVQSGSSFSIAGGISGSFSGSAFLNTHPNFITASHATFTGQYVSQFSGSVTGSFLGPTTNTFGTISGSSLIFSASYFTGSIDGINTETSGSVSGSLVDGFISGSTLLSDTYIGYFSGSLISPTIAFFGDVTGTYLDVQFYQFDGFLACTGLSGDIVGDPVWGNVVGLVSIASTQVSIPSDMIVLQPSMPNNQLPYSTWYFISNPDSPYNSLINSWFTWTGDVWTSPLPILPTAPITVDCGRTHTAQSMVGTFTSGMFSGSQFIAYYSNFSILFGSLSGSLTEAALLGTKVTIPIPSGFDPYAYAYFVGPYVNGTALGKYVISSSIDTASFSSASFSGQFINGDLIGGYVNVQLSGSVYTSSYSYTSSVTLSSSVFSPLDMDQPFTVIIKNLKPEVVAGDMVKVRVFGRQQFPLKTFEKTSQQSQYVTPQLLPSSSFYAIKDNMSEEIIVDFDNYTRISCEYPEGNYFFLDTTGFAQERPYRILIRVEDCESRYTFDDDNVFKVVRGSSVPLLQCTKIGPPAPPAPLPPLAPVLTSLLSGSADLTWISSSNNQTFFDLYKSTDGMTYSNFTTVSGTILNYTDPNVSSGNTYWYKLTAGNSVGTSSYSNTMSINFPDICGFNFALTGSSYSISGYTDGMIPITVGPPPVLGDVVWDGIFKVHYTTNNFGGIYFFYGYDTSGQFPNRSVVNNHEACNQFLKYVCSASVPMWSFYILDINTGKVGYSATKKGYNTPIGTYTYDAGVDLGLTFTNPDTSSIVSTPASFTIIANSTPQTSSGFAQDSCGAT